MDSSFPVLIAEDSLDDQMLIKRAIKKANARVSLYFVSDGEQALQYLSGTGQFSDRLKYPFPSCVITDIKMPRRSGFEVLEWLLAHLECKVIPAIVLSSSNTPSDVLKAYQLGANTYFTKPSDFGSLAKMFQMIVDYWRLAERPSLVSCT